MYGGGVVLDVSSTQLVSSNWIFTCATDFDIVSGRRDTIKHSSVKYLILILSSTRRRDCFGTGSMPCHRFYGNRRGQSNVNVEGGRQWNSNTGGNIITSVKKVKNEQLLSHPTDGAKKRRSIVIRGASSCIQYRQCYSGVSSFRSTRISCIAARAMTVPGPNTATAPASYRA